MWNRTELLTTWTHIPPESVPGFFRAFLRGDGLSEVRLAFRWHRVWVAAMWGDRGWTAQKERSPEWPLSS